MDWYLLLKALHVIAVVTWFAGLFYLPRLFVYHTTAPKAAQPMLETMERKLYKYIMNPSMMAVWTFGILLWVLYPPAGGWLHVKILLVLGLTTYHVHLGHLVKVFAAGANTYSERFYRIYNEVPSLILIVVVILAILKPF